MKIVVSWTKLDKKNFFQDCELGQTDIEDCTSESAYSHHYGFQGQELDHRVGQNSNFGQESPGFRVARAAAALDGLNDVLAQLRHTAEGNSDQLWQQPTRHKLDATPVSNEVTQSDDSGEISMTETTPPFHYGYDDDDDDVTRSKSVYENVGEPLEMSNSEHFDSTFEKFQFLQKVDDVVVGGNRSLPEKQVGSFKFTLLGF